MRNVAVVCMACGRVKGEHGWDESCGMHAVEVYVDTIKRTETGRVYAAQATGRTLTVEERHLL